MQPHNNNIVLSIILSFSTLYCLQFSKSSLLPHLRCTFGVGRSHWGPEVVLYGVSNESNSYCDGQHDLRKVASSKPNGQGCYWPGHGLCFNTKIRYINRELIEVPVYTKVELDRGWSQPASWALCCTVNFNQGAVYFCLKNYCNWREKHFKLLQDEDVITIP